MSDLEDELIGQLRLVGVEEPVREHGFALPKRRWRFDLSWPNLKVAAEVDGGSWSGGRHTRGDGFEKDCEKFNTAAIAGWTVIHCTGKMVKDGRALDFIQRALAAAIEADEGWSQRPRRDE